MTVRVGADRLLERAVRALVRGRRVGLVTNHTGRDSRGRRTADVLREAGATVAAFFAPEHGTAGELAAGVAVPAGTHATTGVPIHSLYGDTKRPTPEMLEGLDRLVYDIQDVGARCFTYLGTLAECMRAAGERGIPVVVLDRPVPTGGTDLDGGVLDLRFASFVGVGPLTMRYAMTVGEVAGFLRESLDIAVDLEIVELEGWRRAHWYDETGLAWVPPSPALGRLEAAALYPGTVLFEGTTLSEGRGTRAPFEWVGAPWIDAERWADRAGALPGVRAVPEARVPRASKHAGARCFGLRLEITDRAVLRPVAAAVPLLGACRDLFGDALRFDTQFDRLAGTDRLRLAIESGQDADGIVRGWEPELAAFARRRTTHLRYE